MIAQSATIANTQQQSSTRHTPLKYQRLLRGWSQRDVVNALHARCVAEGVAVGLNTRTVAYWENGRHLPSPIYRKHLCALYGLDAVQLGFIPAQEVQS